MQKITQIDGKKVAFERHNTQQKGTPLVFLHGLCEDSSIWHDILPACSRPLLTIDLPGFGNSEPPRIPEMASYSLAVSKVLEAENIEKCCLIGHSLGGYVALDFAEKFAEKLSGLGLLHSHPFADSETVRENRRRTIQLVREGKQNQYLSQFFPNLFDPKFAAANPIAVQNLILRAQKFPPEGIIAAHESMMARSDRQETLSQLDVPVLFILGKNDPLISAENAQKMTVLPNIASIHFLENVGHMGMLEVPERILELIENFLRFSQHS